MPTRRASSFGLRYHLRTMDHWELIESVTVPDSGGTMRLMRNGGEFAIHVDERELMRNSMHGSEEALSELACDRLCDVAAPRVLIGGLGMGFTLAALLRRFGDDGQAVVAELVPAVVRWNRGVLGQVAGYPLRDARASIYEGDVGDMIRQPPALWDAILLDVDNGPTGLTRGGNNWLYSWQGLEAAFRALNPQGILAVWSAAPDSGFTRRFERAGFTVECVDFRARGSQGGRHHVIWLGCRREQGPKWQEKQRRY
jgi:spermidine synthase